MRNNNEWFFVKELKIMQFIILCNNCYIYNPFEPTAVSSIFVEYCLHEPYAISSIFVE